MSITGYYDLILLLASSPPSWAILIACVFVILALCLSTFLVFEHLSAYKNPEEQKFLIGVILMVPCYAVESLVSLVDPSISVYFGILRDCYESFAMYCFGRYLVACLGGEERTIEFMERQGHSKTPLIGHDEKGTVKHPFPMNYILKPWKLGQWFYQVVKFGIVQYMLIKSLTAVLAVVLEAFGVYCEGEFKWGCGCGNCSPLCPWFVQKSVSPRLAVEVKRARLHHLYRAQMGVASIVHLYVYPAKPYEMMGDLFPGSVSVLGDYASVDCPLDPDEVRDSERPTKLRLPQPDFDTKSGISIRESVRDVFVGGGGYIANDVKFTVTQAVEPVEKGIIRFNEKLHKISENIKRHDKDKRKVKDDSCLATSSSTRRVIRGIDDPLLNGSFSDTGVKKGRKHRRKSGYTSAESGGESSSDQSYGGYEIRGRRWVSKD
ncbi:protein LAZ1-like isoform X2 [Tripterygium wilfordii]|uniref:protein LAZ1-like isoform X2 n=1 Tax=Tripterygium wilfordii TaxID=458696 RepID=UPI0018F80334|nr:protein LAZ1-like isoform X2 [Tripterygium wilfordii]